MLTAAPVSLSRRLKAETGETHDRLDKRIMAADPFGDRGRYGRFVAVQHLFHRDIEDLYGRAELQALIPDLQGRRRLTEIGDDLADLGLAAPDADRPGRFADGAGETPTALGWLYVAEGSNLGAAFLLKAAERLGFGPTHGARHLAGHPEGRANHWRGFTGAIDGLTLSTADEEILFAGARAAFSRVHHLVDVHLV